VHNEGCSHSIRVLGSLYFCAAWPARRSIRLELLSMRARANIPRKQGIVRPLDPSDERSVDHPCHREQWLELARAIGRLEAREEFNLLRQQKAGSKPNEEASETARDRRRTLRPVFIRRAKAAVD
jgi:hypothetical protein